MSLVGGIDGCRSGWLCLTKDLATGIIQAHIFSHIGDVLMLDLKPVTVLVDVPIGLPNKGSRECDLEARKRLKAPRASSVFPAPIRPVLTATSYEQACQIGESTEGRKLSQQAWALTPKIREVDEFLRADVTRQQWLREVHPEVSFWRWNAGKAMQHRKKTAQGKAERQTLIESHYGAAYSTARLSLPRGRYDQDDLLDAFAALWSAERLLKGDAVLLPETPPVDSCGLRMEMVV